MPQSQSKYLHELTKVPAGWSLDMVIDAFLHLAVFAEGVFDTRRARSAVTLRLLELWASQPEEAEAWLSRLRELCEKTLKAKLPRQDLLALVLDQHGEAEFYQYKCFYRFSDAGLVEGFGSRIKKYIGFVGAWALVSERSVKGWESCRSWELRFEV